MSNHTLLLTATNRTCKGKYKSLKLSTIKTTLIDREQNATGERIKTLGAIPWSASVCVCVRVSVCLSCLLACLQGVWVRVVALTLRTALRPVVLVWSGGENWARQLSWRGGLCPNEK